MNKKAQIYKIKTIVKILSLKNLKIDNLEKPKLELIHRLRTTELELYENNFFHTSLPFDFII